MTAAMIPIGPAPRDEHVLADEPERQRSVHGVAERVEDRRELVRNLGGKPKDVGGRQDEALREASAAVNSDTLGVAAEMPPPGPAIPAMSARDVSLPSDSLSHAVVDDGRSELHDGPDEFVASNQRDGDGLLRPLIPLVNVPVGPADRRVTHLNHDVVRGGSRLFGIGDEPDSGTRMRFDESFHGLERTVGIG